MENSRRAAAFAMSRWLATGDFVPGLLGDIPDRAFVQDMLYTAVRRLRPLRKALGEFVRKWPKGEMEALLYVGAAQILYMPEVPDFAAVNETVQAAKSCPNPAVARTVNAVLRNLARNRERIMSALAAAPVEERESYPTELVRRWEARFGAENAAALAAWHNEPAVTYLARRDGSFEPLGRGRRVEDADGYAAGAFIVQDPATRLAVSLLDPRPGETVLDACAAPGGKTVQIAWRGASVDACEVNPRRRRRLEDNLARLSPGAVRVLDAIPTSGEYVKVLADVPCGNTGVIRRKPDARWNWSAAKLDALVRLQSGILDSCAALVVPGGLLVYSTCSLENEENMGQVESFLSRHPEFSLEKTEESIPFESGFDGAFAASLRKAGKESA